MNVKKKVYKNVAALHVRGWCGEWGAYERRENIGQIFKIESKNGDTNSSL